VTIAVCVKKMPCCASTLCTPNTPITISTGNNQMTSQVSAMRTERRADGFVC
jgi:hypothetical protein